MGNEGRTLYMCKGNKEYYLHNGILNLTWNGPVVQHRCDNQIWAYGPTPEGGHVYYDDPVALTEQLLTFCQENELDTVRLEVSEAVFTTKGNKKIEPVNIDTYHLSLGETTYKASDEIIIRNVVDKFLA